MNLDSASELTQIQPKIEETIKQHYRFLLKRGASLIYYSNDDPFIVELSDHFCYENLGITFLLSAKAMKQYFNNFMFFITSDLTHVIALVDFARFFSLVIDLVKMKCKLIGTIIQSPIFEGEMKDSGFVQIPSNKGNEIGEEVDIPEEYEQLTNRKLEEQDPEIQALIIFEFFSRKTNSLVQNYNFKPIQLRTKLFSLEEKVLSQIKGYEPKNRSKNIGIIAQVVKNVLFSMTFTYILQEKTLEYNLFKSYNLLVNVLEKNENIQILDFNIFGGGNPLGNMKKSKN